MRLIIFCLFLSLAARPAFACSITPSSGFNNLIALACWVGGGSLIVAAFFHLREARRLARRGKKRGGQIFKACLWMTLAAVLALVPVVNYELNPVTPVPLVELQRSWQNAQGE